MDKGTVVVFILADSRPRCGRMQCRTNLPAKAIPAWRDTRLGCSGPLQTALFTMWFGGTRAWRLVQQSCGFWAASCSVSCMNICSLAEQPPESYDSGVKKLLWEKVRLLGSLDGCHWSITSWHVIRNYFQFKPVLLAVRSCVPSWSCAGSRAGDWGGMKMCLTEIVVCCGVRQLAQLCPC